MDVVQERDSQNNVIASYSNGLLARSTASGTVFYGYDGSGNVTSLTDATGALVGSYTYDAWGDTIASSGPKAQENPYRYSGKEQLAGMYQYGYRFYSPGMGRWINRDPIRERGGTNLYEMVGNNPLNHFDRRGLEWDPKDPQGSYERGDVPPADPEPSNSGPGSTVDPLPLPEGGGAGGGFDLRAAMQTAIDKINSLRDDAVQKEHKVITVIVTRRGVYTGTAGVGTSNQQVNDAYNNVDPEVRSNYHGFCGETQAMGDTPADELNGSVALTHNVGSNSIMNPCPSCADVMRQFGVLDGRQFTNKRGNIIHIGSRPSF